MVYRAKCTNILAMLKSELDIRDFVMVKDERDSYIEVSDESAALIIEALNKVIKKRIVWVFHAEQVVDGEYPETITELYDNEADAKWRLHNFVNGDEGELEFAENNGWIIEYNEPNHFLAYEDGCFCQNHTEATVEFRKVNIDENK